MGNLVTSREHFCFGCGGNGIPQPLAGGHCDFLFHQSIRVFPSFFLLYLLSFNVQKDPIES